MKRCVDSLDPYLAQAGFKVDSRHPIKDWEETARQLYATQMTDPKFASEFNVYLWMTKNLFGNHAVAYQLSRDASVEQNLYDLMELKERFRNEVSEKLDSSLNIMVNLEKISSHQPTKIGTKGIVNIGNKPLKEGHFDGRWDYFFFKYIHTSDNPVFHEREENVLRAREVYDSRISDNQWKQMIATGTLTPLNEEVYKND